ncbi:MAG: DUF7009 family protein [Pyrinomonadaceae bacterium]
MKLRIKGNSIRLRLLRSEVERFAADNFVSDELRFGTATDQALKYSLMTSDGIDVVTAQFSDNQILVLLPESIALDWTTTARVGVEGAQEISEGCDLMILVEKDFECVGRPDDPDRADAYENPDGC